MGDNTNGGVGDEVNVASEGSLVCIKTSEPDSHTSSETRERAREGGRIGGRDNVGWQPVYIEFPRSDKQGGGEDVINQDAMKNSASPHT